MYKYYYPALFEEDMEVGGYTVTFPDLPGCITEGDTLEEALQMAKDALELRLYSMEENNEKIPSPSDPKSIKHEEKQFVSLIVADTLEYRKRNSQKSVKKTLTLPQWLNEMAEKNNVNFSLILQEGLKEQLGLKDLS